MYPTISNYLCEKIGSISIQNVNTQSDWSRAVFGCNLIGSISGKLILKFRYKIFVRFYQNLVEIYTHFDTTYSTSCLGEEKEAKLRLSQRPDHSGLDSSSLLDVSTDSWGKETTPTGLELVPQSTWLQCLSTWALRFLSWLAMLPVTTRRPGSSHVTCNWLSATMRSWTNFCPESPLLLEVSYQTSKLCFCPRRPRRSQANKSSLKDTLKTQAILMATHLIKMFK